MATLSRALYGYQWRFWPSAAVGMASVAAAIAVLGSLSLTSGAVLGLVLIGLQVIVALLNRRVWPAQRAMIGMTAEEMATWREEVGGAMPLNAPAAVRWLAAHPEGSAPDWARATMLVLAGEYEVARMVIADLPGRTPEERARRLDVELSWRVASGQAFDTSSADDAVRAAGEDWPGQRALRLGYHGALTAASEQGDVVAPLAAVRSLPPLPAAMVFRLLGVRFFWTALVALAVAGSLVSRALGH